MSTLSKSPEALIFDFHEEEYNDSPILSIEWIGDVMHADQEASLYILETALNKYRYIYCQEKHEVLHVELDWN